MPLIPDLVLPTCTVTSGRLLFLNLDQLLLGSLFLFPFCLDCRQSGLKLGFLSIAMTHTPRTRDSGRAGLPMQAAVAITHLRS